MNPDDHAMASRTVTADGGDERASMAKLHHRPYLALVLEASHPLAGSARFALDGVDEVVFGRASARGAKRRVVDGQRVLEISLPTPSLSSRHARIFHDESGFHVEDLGSRNGTFVRGQRVDRVALADGDRIEVGGAFFVFHPRWPTPVHAKNDRDVRDLAPLPSALRTIVPELEGQYEALRRIAKSKLSVLLLGETGTGKELLARAVHEASGRRGAFVAVNCGALPAALVEGLLFGHKRGAFSGAVRDEIGFVRAADGGTLFLDEIGDLPLASQAALLRVLQEGEVVPVGDTRPVAVDIRVVAATHRPIRALAETNAFRSDLLARLAGFAFDVPALRERADDLGLLVAELMTRLAPTRQLTLGVSAARALVEYGWPLNIRELEQALAAALELTEESVIERSHLPKSLGAQTAATSPSSARWRITGEEMKRLLEEHDGNVASIARVLSKAPVQVRRWLKAFELDPEPFRKGRH